MDGVKALPTSHSIRAYLAVLYRLRAACRACCGRPLAAVGGSSGPADVTRDSSAAPSAGHDGWPTVGVLASCQEEPMAVAFPGESAEYRAARNRLIEQEIELRRAMEAVAEARRGLPPGGVVPGD